VKDFFVFLAVRGLDWREVGSDLLANANAAGGKRHRFTSQNIANERIQV